MCGIVGLLVKKPALREHLGELMLPMLIGMTERGPDSAGMAVFTEPVAAGKRKLSLYSGSAAMDWDALRTALAAALDTGVEISVKPSPEALSTRRSSFFLFLGFQ